MKKQRLLCLTIGWLLAQAVSAQGLAPDIPEKTRALIRLISEIKPNEANDPSKPYLIAALEQSLASGRHDKLAETLGNILLQRNQLGEPVLRLASEIHARLLEERRKTVDGEIQRMNELFRLVGKAAGEAAKPSDLDQLIYQVIDEGSSRQSPIGQDDPRLAGLHQQLSSAKSFLEAWQDSLSESEAGNYQKASSAMRSALNNNRNFLPRSEILEKLSALEGLAQEFAEHPGGKRGAPPITLAEIEEGLANLETAIALMNRWIQQSQRPSRHSDAPIRRFFDRLLNLVHAHERYEAGLPFDLSFATNRSSSSSSEIPIEISKLLNAVELSFAKLALPRYLGLDDAPSCIDGESLDAYFLRLLHHYAQNGRPVEARRIASAKETLRISKSISSDDLTGLRHYAAAQLQLEAGQPRAAVQSLHAALRSGSPLLPAKEIGERLGRIEKEHPEAYRLGTHHPLPGSATVSYTGSFRSFDPPSADSTLVVLPIPGISPKPEPNSTDAKEPASPASTRP